MSVADLQGSVLGQLGSSVSSELNSRVLSELLVADHQAVVGACNSLAAIEMVVLSLVEELQWQLTQEGADLLQHGSHEAKTFHGVPAEGIKQQDLLKLVPSAAIGLGKALKAGWLALDAGTVTRKVAHITDSTQEQLLMIKSSPADPHLDEAVLKELKKRKLALNV